MKLAARIVKRFLPAPDNVPFSLDVTIDADPGVTVLFGASGAGKSLTLDCLAGFAHPDSGRILLGDRILFDGDARVDVRPQRRECGYIFQNSALFPHMTLRENLAFAAERRPRLDRHRRVSEMIERFHLADIAGRYPAEVSGGQRQRCSIARALIAEPQLLLCDEPARGLDASLRSEFYALLRDVRKRLDIPLLIVTHDLDEAVALGDRMLVYEGGRIVQFGVPQYIISRPATANVARIFGHTNLLPVEIVALDPGRHTSRLRLANGDLLGPYFPGHLIGDHATLVIRADDLRVCSEPGENRLLLRLKSRLDHARLVELGFAGGITALVPRHDYESQSDARDWYIEFPVTALRLLGTA